MVHPAPFTGTIPSRVLPHHPTHEAGGSDELFDQNLNKSDSVQFSEIRLTPKISSSGAEGTMFYCSADGHVYVGTI